MTFKEIGEIISNAVRSFFKIGEKKEWPLLKSSAPEFAIPILEYHNPQAYMKEYPVSETKVKKYGINQCVQDVVLMNRLKIPCGFAGGAWADFIITEKRGKITIRKWLPHYSDCKLNTVFALSDRTKFKWDEEPV